MRVSIFIAFTLVHLVFLGTADGSNQEFLPENEKELETQQKDRSENAMTMNAWETDASKETLLSMLSDARQNLHELEEKLKQKDQTISLLEKNVKDLSHHLQQLDWLAGRISGEKFEIESELRECTQTHPSMRRQQPNPFNTNPFGLNPHQTNPFQLNPLRLTPFKMNPFQ